MIDGLLVEAGDGTPTLVPQVEQGEFSEEYGGLQFVETAVAAAVTKVIAAVAAIVAKGSDDGCEFCVVGGDCACIAQRTEVLGGIETVGGGMTETSGSPAFKGAAVSLGIVFNEQQVMPGCDAAYLVGICAPAIEVHDHDGARSRCDGGLNKTLVNLQGVCIGFHEHGDEPVFGYGENGGDVGVGGDDDLVAWMQSSHLLIGTED